MTPEEIAEMFRRRFVEWTLLWFKGELEPVHLSFSGYLSDMDGMGLDGYRKAYWLTYKQQPDTMRESDR